MTPEARCAGDPLFDAPSPGARAVCLTCPLVIQCATGALVRGERWGVWGGLDLSDPRTHRATTRDRVYGRTVEHGTMTAWKRHERAREPLCEPCRAGRIQHVRDKRAERQTA